MLWHNMLVPAWVMRALGPVQAALALAGGWLGMALLMVDCLRADGGARLWPVAALALLAPAVAAVTALLGAHYWYRFDAWWTMWRHWDSDARRFAAYVNRTPSGAVAPAQSSSADGGAGGDGPTG